MAPISLTDTTPYTQNFDSLAISGATGTTLPDGWEFIETGTNANSSYGVNNGSSNGGNTYSYGSTDAADRAFGGLRSGSLIPIIGASFTNNTGSIITELQIAYTGEQWRLGTAGRTDRLDFQYSLDATSLTTGSWTDVDALDFTTPNTVTTGAKDGNASGNFTNLSTTITGLNIANGSTFFIRYTDFDASGADDGLAVDDFSLTPVFANLNPTVNLSVSSNSQLESDATAITVTATASAAVTGNQTINLDVSNIDASDFNLSNTTITILDGETTGSVTFTIVNDSVLEGNEIATLILSNPSAGIDLGSTTSQDITIIDNDVIQITEYLYVSNGSTQREFVELTNVGTTAIDLTDWSFDDNTQISGSFSIGDFGMVAPNESVIITETIALDFRTNWNLAESVKVIGGLNQGLGRNDEINIYDNTGALVDRLTYGDEDFPGTVRARNASAWTTSNNLDTFTINAGWVLSSAGDVQNSVTATNGDIGSPGTFVPSAPVLGVPTIAINTTNTTNFLDGGTLNLLPISGSGAVSGVISDPTDPASTLGIDFTIADSDTPIGNLTVTAASSNQSVVSNANLILSGTGTGRNLKITPSGVGLANITVTVSDGSNSSNYVINYGASAASVNPTTTRFLTGTSDASSAIAIDSQFVFVADDEDQTIRLYDRTNSGLPIAAFDFTSSLGLSGNSEVDIEASSRVGNTIYWLGSHSNNSSGEDRPNRERIFSTTISGSGVSSSLAFGGYYQFLEDDLIAWDNANGHGLGAGFLGLAASAANGVAPELTNGFNIEGLTFAPNSDTTAYVSFRAPQLDTTDRTDALIVPVTNFTTILDSSGGTSGSATFAAPIFLDLGGRGIRSIERNSNNQYLIAAGPAGAATGSAPNDFRLYTWTGNSSDAPVLRLADLTALNASGGSFESIVEVPNSLTASTQIELLVDNGDSIWYGDTTVSKQLSQTNQQKFRREVVQLGAADAITKISEVQGSGEIAALLNDVVTVEAIVVGDFQRVGDTFNLRGFYLQEEDADADGNPLTSEGIFVFDDTFGVDVKVGDKVRVTGTVSEFTTGTSSLTQINNVINVSIQSENNTLPTAAIVEFPILSTADLEAFEGMLVTIPTTLAVTENFQLGRFGQVVLASNGASNQSGTDIRLDQFTQFNAPNVENFAAYQAEIAKRRIVLDDGLTVQNPDSIKLGRGGNPLSATNTLRGGDTVTGLTGILDSRFGDTNVGNYRIQPFAPVDFQATNPRPDAPPEVGGTLKVGSFNVLNYFNGDGLGGGFPTPRGADNALEFTRQRDKIINAIIGTDADVLGLIEIENDGYEANSAIQDLVNGLNSLAGANTYAFIDPRPAVLAPTDAITVGMIYKVGKVTPVGNAATLAGSQAFDDGTGRRPLAQTFQEVASGQQFTAVVSHFKSKGSSAGFAGDADALDGQGFSNGTRTRTSQDLVAWLSTNPTGTADPDYVILGDLNAYANEDPIVTIENAGYTNLLPESSYSFVFNGQLGSLDYALGSSSFTAQVTGATEWAINVDEPNALDYNTENKSAAQIDSLYNSDPFRSSDHDPLIVGLNLIFNNSYTYGIDRSANSVTEGNSGSQDVIFTVNRVGTGTETTVNYALGGTATLGVDYTTASAASGTLTFAANETSKTITVSILGDTDTESNETIILGLSNPQLGVFSSNNATVIITNDEVVTGDIFGTERSDSFLIGTDGNDTIRGLAGNDRLTGGDGNDRLFGGLGRDVLTGGTGADFYSYESFAESVLNNMDSIPDFIQTEGDRFEFTNTTITGLFNAGAITGVNITAAATSAFADKDKDAVGAQVLGENEGVFFSYLGSTYLGVNDSTSAFSASTDFLTRITRFQGVGSASVASLAGSLNVVDYITPNT
jgi:predicted extracellular nuclease